MAIVAEGLTKQYGDKLAVDNLSLTIEPGRVTGFLGPNGAGKSTTMRMMLDIDRATRGTTTFDGQRFSKLDSPLKMVGSMLDANAVEPKRSAQAHLRYLAASAGLPDSRVGEVLALTGLTDAAKRLAGNFSLGMHQRLGIAAALLGDPKYLFFDEPTNGLDPEGIRWVREFLQQLAGEGRGVLVSSHLLSELSLYVDHIVVIGKGRFIASGSVHEFESMRGQAAVTVQSPRLTELVALDRAAGWPRHADARWHRGDRHDRRCDRGPSSAPPDRTPRVAHRAPVARGNLPRAHRRRAGIPIDRRRAGGVVMRNLVRAEWIKFASLRASWTRLGVAFLLNGVFVVFTLWAFNRSTGDSVPDTSIAARVGTLSAGVSMAALVFIVMGINAHTAEIKSRTIIPTAGAAPDRRDLIGAKAALSGAVGLAAGAAVMLLTTVACLIVLDAAGLPAQPAGRRGRRPSDRRLDRLPCDRHLVRSLASGPCSTRRPRPLRLASCGRSASNRRCRHFFPPGSTGCCRSKRASH